jgi:hypothetical protein
VAPLSQWDGDFKRRRLSHALLWVLSGQPCYRQSSSKPRAASLHDNAARHCEFVHGTRLPIIDESSIGYLDKNHTFPNQKQLNTKDYQQQTKCR